MANLDAALAYAAKGYCVFPVHHMKGDKCSCNKWKCNQKPLSNLRGKHPRFNGWQEKATTETSTIKKWWDRWPDDNIGIATGQKSNLVIIDIDPRNGGDKSLQNLVNSYDDVKPALGTHTVSTGGNGTHYYYTYKKPFKPKKKQNSYGLLGLGIDVQADGKYIIAPPSNHYSGGTYSVANDIAPIPLPEILIDLSGDQRAIEAVIADVLEGGRNDWLAEQAGSALREGKTPNSVRTYLLERNALYCKPPLDYTEVDAIADSMINGYDPSTSSVSKKTLWQKQIIRARQDGKFVTVCMALGEFMDQNGHNCYPNQDQIAEICGVTEKTVRIHLRKAEELGFLTKYQRGKNGQRGFNYGYVAVIKTQDR